MDSHAAFLKTYIAYILLTGVAMNVQAESSKIDIGVRFNVELGDGTPANDILGYGIYGIYKLSPKWGVGAGLDVADYDFENPAQHLGISSSAPKIIDAPASSTMVSVWGERYFEDFLKNSIVSVNAGIGVNTIDVDNATGPVQGGGTWEAKTDVDTDMVIFGGVGIKHAFDENWAFDGNLSAKIHRGDWVVEDLNSNAKTSISGFNSWNLQLGITRVF